ncbi:hypothetical protein Acr_09g0000770 [Actinidia rufa]|uniref:Uncharacterized protein n=1 Tax=Actinidia rufa TaxID=165716 RepID=A0A7J0F4L2_9ERIC|nr:hypothetical protein Acr_09g0000770 [Actinidia rufa]
MSPRHRLQSVIAIGWAERRWKVEVIALILLSGDDLARSHGLVLPRSRGFGDKQPLERSRATSSVTALGRRRTCLSRWRIYPTSEMVTQLRLVHPPSQQLYYKSDSLELSTRLRSGLGFILMDPRSESTRPRFRTDTAVRRDGPGGEIDEALQQFSKDTACG